MTHRRLSLIVTKNKVIQSAVAKRQSTQTATRYGLAQLQEVSYAAFMERDTLAAEVAPTDQISFGIQVASVLSPLHHFVQLRVSD